MPTTANMSALEWFFRKPPASNFPQNASSPELRQLRKAVDQLATALIRSESTDAQDQGKLFLQWETGIESLSKIENAQLQPLLRLLSASILLVRRLDTQNITDGFNATVIALVILAKTSQSIEFRKGVVVLAKELIPHGESSREVATN